MAIQSIFMTPGFAIARLGSATAPVDNYYWAEVEEPRYDGETTVVPDWSLAVEADASVTPFLPDAVTFRDGERIRPVAPLLRDLGARWRGELGARDMAGGSAHSSTANHRRPLPRAISSFPSSRRTRRRRGARATPMLHSALPNPS